MIGGGFGMAARDWILDPARHVLASEAVHPMAGTPVVSARLGPRGRDARRRRAAAPGMSEPPRGRLVVCATPIGNLGDVTPRVLDALRGASVVACEDTRRTATLLAAHGISVPLVPLHDHNEARRTPELIERLAAGDRVAWSPTPGCPPSPTPATP